MKKLVTLLLCMMMLLTSAALAENMGVQVIGGPDMGTEPVSLDDLKLDVDAEIEGYGIIKATALSIRNYLGYYGKGNSYNSVWGWKDYRQSYNSGNEAEYVMLKMDITNTTLKARNYMDNFTVKAVFDDVYEYAGWAYQFNYDYGEMDWPDGGKSNTECVIDAADVFAIGPMYTGHYLFGVTLPNAVVNSKKPLKIVIMLDGNEITYNVRK